jgi:hypothetical protein
MTRTIDHGRGGRFVTCFVAGVLVGASIGFLLGAAFNAPKSQPMKFDGRPGSVDRTTERARVKKSSG